MTRRHARKTLTGPLPIAWLAAVYRANEEGAFDDEPVRLPLVLAVAGAIAIHINQHTGSWMVSYEQMRREVRARELDIIACVNALVNTAWLARDPSGAGKTNSYRLLLGVADSPPVRYNGLKKNRFAADATARSYRLLGTDAPPASTEDAPPASTEDATNSQGTPKVPKGGVRGRLGGSPSRPVKVQLDQLDLGKILDRVSKGWQPADILDHYRRRGELGTSDWKMLGEIAQMAADGGVPLEPGKILRCGLPGCGKPVEFYFSAEVNFTYDDPCTC